MKGNKQQAGILAIGSAAVLGSFLLFKGCIAKPLAEKDGLAYLASLDQRDLEAINETIQQKKMDQLVNSYASGETDIFSLFQDYVFLGDSRANGFKAYGFLEDSRVLAEVSQTIKNVDQYLDVIESLKPTTVIISYGINDMASNLGSDKGEDGYIELMKEKVAHILEKSPNAKIVVNSINPATPSTMASNPEWGNYVHYSDMVKRACEKYGWVYVDNNDISQNGQAPIYEGDGIHFIPSFYKTWAENIMNQVALKDKKTDSESAEKKTEENKSDESSSTDKKTDTEAEKKENE
mgnify:FL=1